MRPLKEKHSGFYMNKVLLDTLIDYNIELDITRYIFIS
jgi:hypothetical protein